MTDYYPLSEAQMDDLMEQVTEGHTGDQIAFACDADPDEHIHVHRVGRPGAGLGSRVAISAHDADDDGIVIFLSAPEARAFAAFVLNAADEVDGDVPLMYADATFIEKQDMDTAITGTTDAYHGDCPACGENDPCADCDADDN